MTTLHDRLAELAADAPPGGPAPGLWEQGRLVARRRRVGTAVIVAVVAVLLTGLVTVDWRRSVQQPQPARGSVGLPDQVWDPSAWLPTTEQPGQLVAMSSAERGSWTRTDAATLGISAVTGDYAFFDLPQASENTVELAPDGRHVAYWLTGRTTGTPNTKWPPITGVAVYDTTTGDVSPHWISTAHGLEPDFLAWTDDDTVVFSAGQIRGGDDDPEMDQSNSTFGTVTAWALGDEPRPVLGVRAGATLQGAAHGRLLVDNLLVDLSDPAGARRITVPELPGSSGHRHYVALGVDAGQIALVVGTQSPGPVKAGQAGRLRPVADSRASFGVEDWIDRDTIITAERIGGWRTGASGLIEHSLPASGSRELVRFPVDSYGGDWQFATDLLSAPTYDAVEPPRPLDPRLARGAGIVVVFAGAAALVLWRRRVRV